MRRGTATDRLAGWLAIVTVAVSGGCSSVDMSSSNANDPAEQAQFFITSFGAIGLGIGTTAFFTVDPATGHPLSDRREISLAIARGSGPFVTDLAHWLELPPRLMATLGETLRAARPVLEPALDAPITVRSFESLLGVALCRQPQLRYHAWKRFPCERLAPLHSLPVAPDSLVPPGDPAPG